MSDTEPSLHPELNSVKGKIKIAIDRGGTFTDCIGSCPGKQDVVIKLLSEDPSNYKDAPREAIRRVLETYTGEKISRDEKLDTSFIDTIRMGTTVATNALLERKGAKCALITTRGYRDILKIGNQSRPDIFNLNIQKPQVLYDYVIEIDERVTLEEYTENPEKGSSNDNDDNNNNIANNTNNNNSNNKVDADNSVANSSNLVRGISGEIIRILKSPDENQVIEKLTNLKKKSNGKIESLAICFLHSYTFPQHEIFVANIAKKLGFFKNISISSSLMPMIKFVPRSTSTVADAYLTPVIKNYIQGFSSGFKGKLGVSLNNSNDNNTFCRCEFMQSDGGLVDVKLFSGLKAILSGPAGGVVGYAKTSYDNKTKIPVIGFDMGGTSTDVSRIDENGRYTHVFETTIAGITIQSPQLDINTVAAGGGSRLYWKNGLFVVGPESAGAHPGPACYRKNGPLTVTDANLVLGRLIPSFFPKIFGPNENEPLSIDASLEKFKILAKQISADLKKELSVDEVAYGFLQVANEAMTRPIRALTEAKGFDSSTHRLATFGGAGGQHAVAIAEALGIKEILVHKYSSVLSAYGMALADVVHEIQEPSSIIYSEKVNNQLETRFKFLCDRAKDALNLQGFEDSLIIYEKFLNMRYEGTESALMIIEPSSDSNLDYGEAFIKQHMNEFGFIFPNRNIIVDDVRVRGIGKLMVKQESTVDEQLRILNENQINISSSKIKPFDVSKVYFVDKRVDTPIYKIETLPIGTRISGPAIIADKTQTLVIEPNSEALILKTHVFIERLKGNTFLKNNQLENLMNPVNVRINPILLSIFSHRFMAIAEQMGRSLQKTAVSTNVKERLDYSCALFDSKGSLVANAPHLPVHLGSMSTAVRMQAEKWAGKLSPGDVLVTNHPSYGGTHLPDITVITPSFCGDKILFYVASRAHHADIGGILPGSMPPSSRYLFEEGAAIYSEKLVSKGKFNDARMKQLFFEEPAKFPGCSGTRRLSDNISDLKAQAAANKKGINLISQLLNQYGTEVVLAYMNAIQENARNSVRKLLHTVSSKYGSTLCGTDFMDDGTPINLKISISSSNLDSNSNSNIQNSNEEYKNFTAIFDFSGTGPQVFGNTNAPEAITYSAVLYCLRCLISDSIPLNQGCLDPIKFIIPKGSILSPSNGAAVVGGNVLTSQRVTDVVLRAFGACGASQGDCNNLTFGVGGKEEGTDEVKSGWGYYETIGGGAGAGNGFNGASGVHTHMTNTRMTDTEVMEKRYPVIVREFSLRENSGGLGKWSGGNGIVRAIEFRVPVTCSILSERRVTKPYGMKNGQPGKCGINLWLQKPENYFTNDFGNNKNVDTNVNKFTFNINSYYAINLGGKNSASFKPGDVILIETPGGGGYGSPQENVTDNEVPIASLNPRYSWHGGSVSTYIMNQETV